MAEHAYGRIKDTPDGRDFRMGHAMLGPLPTAIDLRNVWMPKIVDQGQLGSCVGNGVARVFGYAAAAQGLRAEMVVSRLFIYYGARAIEGTVGEDAGCQVRDGLKTIATLGAPTETAWPYNIAKFAKRPPKRVYATAANNRAVVYARVTQTPTGIRAALAAGRPVVFGFTVYESFESDAVAHSGVMPVPSSGEQELGGHCVVLVGYDDAKARYIVANSWGTDWGQAGYFTMPYAVAHDVNMSSDYWVLDAVN